MASIIENTNNPVIHGHTEKLALFKRLPMNTGIVSTDTLTFRPANAVSASNSCIEINLHSAAQYLDLSTARVCGEFRVVHADGSALQPRENVAFTNAIGASLIGQLDCTMNRISMSKLSAPLHSYKKYLDILTSFGEQPAYSWLGGGEIWSKDTSGAFDVCTRYSAKGADKPDPLAATNLGFNYRVDLAAESRIVQFSSKLDLDVFCTGRLLLNNVEVALKFWLNPPEFYLMSPRDDVKYRIEIQDIYVTVDAATLQSELLIAHAETLKASSAIYPYVKSDLRLYSLSKASLGFTTEAVFSGSIPSKVFCVLVNSQAMNGRNSLCPWNFHHYDVSKISFSVNNIAQPGGSPQSPRFAEGNYMECFINFFKACHTLDSNLSAELSYYDYARGNCVFAWDIDYFNIRGNQNTILPTPRLGATSLSIQFSRPLPHAVNLLVYGQFSDAYLIDMTRRVKG